MIVYADILFLENLIANFLILKLTATISGFDAKTLRLFLASSLGAIYAVLGVIVPYTAILSGLLTRIIVSALMILVAFKIRTLPSFLRRWGMMLLSAFLLAGCTYGLSSLLDGGAIAYGGLMYVSPQGILKAFLLSTALCIILVRPIGRILSGKAFKEGAIVPVYIKMGDQSVRFYALVDTGNSLIDPLTGYPVMVVEAESLKTILPKEIYEAAISNNINIYIEHSNKNSWIRKFHLIPFKSIGKENGMLTGFRPDNIKIGKEGSLKEINDVIVGICGVRLSHSAKYSALIGPAMLSKI